MAADRGTGNVAPSRTTGVRTWSKADPRVVATTPGPFQYSSGYSPQQNARRADVAASQLPFVSGAQQDAEDNATANAMANAALGLTGTGTGATGTGTDTWSQMLKALQGGSGTGGGSKLSSADVALQELKYKMQQDALERSDTLAAQQKQDALNASILRNMQEQLSSGSYRGNIDKILGMYEAMGKKTGGNIENIYQEALKRIGGGYGAAETLMGAGYDALDKYLAENPNDPYAGLKTQADVISNPMEQYLSAYGVPTGDVQAQVGAEQIAGQQGAGAFNTLASLLSAASQQANKSRIAEALMGRKAGLAGLGQQKAALESSAEMSRAQALAQLQQQIDQSKLEQEIAAENARQALVDKIIGAGGNIGTLTGANAGGLTPIEQVIQSAGGATTQPQFEQGIADLAAALAGIGYQG